VEDLTKSSVRQELAVFLASRRARLSPADVGLHVGRRRRVPGLRREEVAVLANVSQAWYTRLEQGRPINVSVPVLDNIARALRLDNGEREYLFALALAGDRGANGANAANAANAANVSPAIAQMVDALTYAPAVVYGPTWDVLRYNAAYAAVFGRIEDSPAAHGNVVREVFLDPSRRRLFPDWESVARRLLQAFRLSLGSHVGDPANADAVRDLRDRSAEFRTWWDERNVFDAPQGRKLVDHPIAGRLEFDHVAVTVTDEPFTQMIVYTAEAGSESERRLHRVVDAYRAGAVDQVSASRR